LRAAANQAIVFRQHFPPRWDTSTLSFFGGTHVWKWTQSVKECPKLLPKWTFEPVAIEIGPEAYQPDEQQEEENGPLLWPGDEVVTEPLLRAQGEDPVSSRFSIRDFIEATDRLRRPFANFPHDWRAVQICSGLLLEKLRHRLGLAGAAQRRQLSEEQRDALLARIGDEARGWFDRADS
jgi:hypothetical protein